MCQRQVDRWALINLPTSVKLGRMTEKTFPIVSSHPVLCPFASKISKLITIHVFWHGHELNFPTNLILIPVWSPRAMNECIRPLAVCFYMPTHANFMNYSCLWLKFILIYSMFISRHSLLCSRYHTVTKILRKFICTERIQRSCNSRCDNWERSMLYIELQCCCYDDSP